MADGIGCKCNAWYASECCCNDIDWRSAREVELEDACAELTDLCDKQSAQIDELESRFQQTHVWLCERNEQLHEQAAALKLAKEALESSLTACISFSALRKANEALAAIDALEGDMK